MTEKIDSQSEDFVLHGTMWSDECVLARAAGKLHGEIVRQYLKDFHEAEGNTTNHIRLTFNRLQHMRVLSKSEVLCLERILTLLNNHEASSADALKVIRDVYNALVDAEAGPCAVALASIAENSVHLAIEMGSANKKVNWWAVLGADLKGAAEGTVVEPGWGTVIGAAISSGSELMNQNIG